MAGSFRPVIGTTRIAYVNSSTGDDGTGTLRTWGATDSDPRVKPGGINAFATHAAAKAAIIAAVGYTGPHAILLASGQTFTAQNDDSGYFAAVNSGGSAPDRPRLLGSYHASGSPSGTREGDMATIDAPLSINIQGGSPVSNIICEGIRVRRAARIYTDGAYNETNALADHYHGLRMSNSGGDNILFRNMIFEGHGYHGVSCDIDESNPYTSNVTFDDCVFSHNWQAGESVGSYIARVNGLRFLNCQWLGNGQSFYNPSITWTRADPSPHYDRNHNLYIHETCRDVTIDNCIAAFGANAGFQLRVGATVRRCLAFCNADNFAIGHDLNKVLERDIPVYLSNCVSWGTKDIDSGLKTGRHISCGRTTHGRISRVICNGDSAQYATDQVASIYLGRQPRSNGKTLEWDTIICHKCVPSGMASPTYGGGIVVRGGGGTIDSVLQRFRNCWFHEPNASSVVRAEGNGSTADARISTKVFVGNVYHSGQTLYGGPTSAPSGLSGGFVARNLGSLSTALGTSLPTHTGHANYTALVEAIRNDPRSWSASRIINKVFGAASWSQVSTSAAV